MTEKKIFKDNETRKQAGIVILIFDKIDFRSELISMDTEDNYSD